MVKNDEVVSKPEQFQFHEREEHLFTPPKVTLKVQGPPGGLSPLTFTSALPWLELWPRSPWQEVFPHFTKIVKAWIYPEECEGWIPQLAPFNAHACSGSCAGSAATGRAQGLFHPLLAHRLSLVSGEQWDCRFWTKVNKHSIVRILQKLPGLFRHFFLMEKLQKAENERICCSLGGNGWACCPQKKERLVVYLCWFAKLTILLPGCYFLFLYPFFPLLINICKVNRWSSEGNV